jgi:uncharacterized protein (DUF433 family)
MISDSIRIDPDILGGSPVFAGTHVPVYMLFTHLEKGMSVHAFLERFPSVSKAQALDVLAIACRVLSSAEIKTIYARVNG